MIYFVLIQRDHAIWQNNPPPPPLWKNHCCFANTISIHYTAITPQQYNRKGQLFPFRCVSQLVPTCCSTLAYKALTLLSMAPMMLGPWQCNRLSWFTGWWRIRFFTISRKAAMLFLSSLPSEREQKKLCKTTLKISCATRSCTYALQTTILTLSYLRITHTPCLRVFVSLLFDSFYLCLFWCRVRFCELLNYYSSGVFWLWICNDCTIFKKR